MPTRAFSKFQYGKETVRGTAVAATRILLAEIAGVPVDRKPTFVRDALGVRAEAFRSRVDNLLVEDTLRIPNAYYQVLPALFDCGLKGGVVASEQTVGQGDYLWTFLPAMGANNNPDSITLEMGDDVQAFRTEFVMFKRIKIHGVIAQDAGPSPMDVEADYFGRQMTPNAFTGALSLPTPTTINAKLARLYKDATWAGRGTTELASILREFEAEILTGVHPKFFGDGNKFFSTFGEDVIAAMLTLTVEGDAQANAFYTEFQAETAKAHTLKINGPQIGTGTNHNLTVSVWGKPELVVPLSAESSGNNLHRILIHGLYDPTGANLVEAKVTTNQNAI